MWRLRGDMYSVLLESSCAFRDDFILFATYQSAVSVLLLVSDAVFN